MKYTKIKKRCAKHINILLFSICFFSQLASSEIFVIDKDDETNLTNIQNKILGGEYPSIHPTKYGANYDHDVKDEIRFYSDYLTSAAFDYKYKLRIDSKGRLYTGNKKLLHSKDGYEIKYYMDNDGTIYISQELNDDTRYYHSSFIRFEYPIAAGTMEIVNGNLSVITNDTGHFASPPDRTMLVLRVMRNINEKFQPQSVQIINYEENLVERMNFPAYKYRRFVRNGCI